MNKNEEENYWFMHAYVCMSSYMKRITQWCISFSSFLVRWYFRWCFHMGFGFGWSFFFLFSFILEIAGYFSVIAENEILNTLFMTTKNENDNNKTTKPSRELPLLYIMHGEKKQVFTEFLEVSRK